MSIRINFNGPSIGNEYMSHAQAVANGMKHTAKYTVNRYIPDWYYRGDYGREQYRVPDGDSRYTLYSTGIWSDQAFSLRYPIRNGMHYVCFEVAENSKDYAKNFEIAVEGQVVIPIPPMRRGEYMVGGAEVAVHDSELYVAIRPIGDSEVHLMSMYIL